MKLPPMDDLHRMEQPGVLLQHPVKHRDHHWLEHALQVAVSVELSTIPPYLCALWSIRDDRHPMAASIRNVVQEEMLHMSLACNMLTAIGCVPQINSPRTVPRYPGPLPGKVHEGLRVNLSGLTDDALDTFLSIEEPEQLAPPGKPADPDAFPTIGFLYDAIRDAFRDLRPELSPERQVSGPLAHMVMEDLDAVEAAIALIKDQGEGTTQSAEVEHTHELAHYYRFLQLRQRRPIDGLDQSGNPVYGEGRLEFPETWPMAVVPEGGYQCRDVPEDAWKLIDGCDRGYTQLLDRLQNVWEHGDQASLVHGIAGMFALSEQARRLMAMEIAPGRGNYGPCFRLLRERSEASTRERKNG